MIAINMEYFEINREYISSKKFIVNCIYIILCLFTIIINNNYKRKNENRVQEVQVEDKAEEAVGSANETVEEEILGIIRPVVNEVTFTSLEEEVMETLKIYEFEGTGEQLRRLRAYNPKFDGETDERYEKRIWDMAYEEDEEEAKQKVVKSVAEVASEAAVVEENLPVSNEVVISAIVAEAETVLSKAENLEKDVNTWYKFEDGKGRYKGEWKNGMPNGKGIKHIYKDDSYIYGNFVDGSAYGYGKQTFEQTWEKTQPYYEGEFKRNNYDGKGEYHYGDGDYYKGDWKHNKYHGQGAAYSLRLDKTWVGEYENDVKGEGNWVKGEI